MLTLKEKVSIDCDKLSRDHLTCASCLEVYDRSLRLPKVLKCHGYHSICKQCLGSICSQPESVIERSFSCPICRQKVEIPTRGVSEFPPNPLLIQLLDLLDNHELVPECPKHPFQEPQYCETCDALFCDLCHKESHNHDSLSGPKHTIISASRAIKEVQKKLSDEADKWISDLDKAHKLVALMMENVEQNSGTVLEEIDLIFGKINSLADKRHKELLTLVHQMRRNKVEILQDQLQLIENEKAKVTTEFKKFQYRGADGEIKEKIEDLRNRTKSMKVSLSPRTNCSIHHDLTKRRIEEIHKAIENCGTIWTSETSVSLSELTIGKCFAQMRTLMTILTTDYFMYRHENNSDCIKATLSGPPGQCTNIPLKITDGRNNTFKIHFIPPQPGIYHLRVTISSDENEDEEYDLKFTVNAHKNPIYESQEVRVDAEVVKKIIPNTELDFMKLMANSLYCEVGEKSSNWAVDSKRAPDPLMDFKPILMKNKQSPLYCRLVDTMYGSKILCATSLDYSKTAWICVEKSSCSQIMLVNFAKESKNWVKNSLSYPGRILCITSIPIWGFFFMNDRKIDKTYTQSVKFDPDRSDINGSSSENEFNSTIPSTCETPQTSPFESSEDSSIQKMPRHAATDTLWLGSEDGTIYIWIRQNRSGPCVSKIKLAHSVLKIVHSRNRVFVALANGHCIVFIESLESVLKKSSEYFLINMGEIKKKFDEMRNSSKNELKSFGSITVDSLTQNAATSESLLVDQNLKINCMESVGDTIWLGYQNCIYILECETLRAVFELRINYENARVEHLTNSGGGGVWCCIRLQSHQIIQLISANKPYQKILAIDIRPELRKLLIPTFTDLELDSLARITALKASEDHLWIGTAAGLVLNIPYSLPFLSSKCDLYKTQLSLHGFGGAVKFFLMLNNGIVSGGEGYRDLNTDPDGASNGVLNEDYPHVIRWVNSSGA